LPDETHDFFISSKEECFKHCYMLNWAKGRYFTLQ